MQSRLVDYVNQKISKRAKWISVWTSIFIMGFDNFNILFGTFSMVEIASQRPKSLNLKDKEKIFRNLS